MESSDCVMKGLYVGGILSALNEKHLVESGINYILSMDEKPLPDILTHKYTYRHVFALDLYDFDLLHLLPDCCKFIDEARDAGGAVLVHCQAGMSRSVTVVAAYLMRKLGIDREQALDLITTVRPQIRPNDGFMEQLQLFENMGCEVDMKHPEYRSYQLSRLAVKFKTGQYGQGANEEEFPLEVLVASDYSARGDDDYFKCKKCRKFLFRQSVVTSHPVGEGSSAFDWRSKVPANKLQRPSEGDGSRQTCARSLFIDPLDWMRGRIYDVAGKLHCPKCDIKLGSYVWYGEKCPCGAWVAPAFHIDSGKVDRIPSAPVAPQTQTAVVGPSVRPSSMTPPPNRQLGSFVASESPCKNLAPLPSSHHHTPNRPTAVVTAVAPQISNSNTDAAASNSSSSSLSFAAALPPISPSMDLGIDADVNISHILPAETGADIASGISSISMDVDS